MGFWDSLFGRRPPSSPEEVQKLLFDAVARGDEGALTKLAAEHEATVLEHFTTWQKAPEAVRRDPAAVQRYALGLIGVAQHFAEARGHDELLAALTGRAEDNPVTRWERALAQADARMEACDYTSAAELLRTTLEATKGLTGSGVDKYLPMTLGRLATCLFQTGNHEEAIAQYDRALTLCDAVRDDDGVRAYLGNLYEAHRYHGNAEEAAKAMVRRAELHERLGEPERALRDRQQAAIVRAGEPPCRVVAEIRGELIEIADVRPSEEHVRFVFARNRLALRRCTTAVEAGVAAGQSGDLEGALASFKRAAELDRFDPWPSYHAGMTLLHLRRYREALDSFDVTEDIAPGWYHVRADRWLSECLVKGAIDDAMFERIRGLVDGAPTPERALTEARRALAQKELGLLRLLAGNALRRLGRAADAETEYRRGLAIAEEPDVKTRLLTTLGGHVAERGEKERLLLQASELRGNLVAAAMATVMLRAA